MIRTRLVSVAALLLCATFFVSCESTNEGEPGLPAVQVTVERAYPTLDFRRPVDFQTAPADDDHIYVVEQAGDVFRFENRQDVETMRLFMSITDRVSRNNNEEGLLGLAFHPQYAQNGFVYVYYSAAQPRRSVLARYTARDAMVDRSSEVVLLEVPQPYGNHNAGQLQFGPDGYLYVSLGDGGSGGDPLDHSQNLRTHLGAMLRIDVDRASNGRNYGIPADNPFVGNSEGFKEEIYAYGLRNPWRFSFDRETGQLWLADVGQERFEEVNLIERGGNYGWNTLEALTCFEPQENCPKEDKIRPVYLYNHTEGRSITGGYVYHGTRIPNLAGRYVYGDYTSGKIWALQYDGSAANNQFLASSGLPIAAFGQDQAGEVYILSLDGQIYRFAPKG